MAGDKLPLGEVLSFGWGAFKQRAGFWIGVAAVLFGVSIGYQILGGIFAGVFSGSGLLLGVISLALLAAYVYAQTRLTIGITSMALATADGGAPGFESLLAKPHLLLPYFLAYLLFSIATSIGFLLLVIPGVYLLIRFGLFGFAIVDKETGVVDSFNAITNPEAVRKGFEQYSLRLVPSPPAWTFNVKVPLLLRVNKTSYQWSLSMLQPEVRCMVMVPTDI